VQNVKKATLFHSPVLLSHTKATEMLKNFTLLFCCIVSLPLLAQTYSINIDWDKTYPLVGIPGSWENEVCETSDLGFIIAGTTDTIFRGLLLKTNSTGDTTWSKKYGTDLQPVTFHAVAETNSGGYIAAGAIGPYWTAYMIKTDALGNVLATRQLACNGSSIGSVMKTADGGYIFGGSSQCDSLGYEPLLIKTDSNLNIQWSRDYGEFTVGQGKCAIQTLDGGFIITFSENLLKTDALGIPQWIKSTSITNGIQSIIQLADSAYVMCGSSGGANTMTHIEKRNSQGNPVWIKSYFFSNQQGMKWIKATADSGFAVAGYTTTNLHPCGWQMMLMKTDANGDSIWCKQWSLNNQTGRVGFCSDLTSDGGFVVLGQTMCTGFEYNLVKIKSVLTSVHEPPENPFEQMEVFPNPAHELFFISFANKEKARWEICIYNAVGEKVYGSIINGNVALVDCGNLSPGFYFAQAINGNTIIYKKIVKE
jgi:hypothetical protein